MAHLFVPLAKVDPQDLLSEPEYWCCQPSLGGRTPAEYVRTGYLQEIVPNSWVASTNFGEMYFKVCCKQTLRVQCLPNNGSGSGYEGSGSSDQITVYIDGNSVPAHTFIRGSNGTVQTFDITLNPTACGSLVQFTFELFDVDSPPYNMNIELI